MNRLLTLLFASATMLPAAASAQATLPAGVTERELAVIGGPVTLPGTLTLPAGKGPFPAVIIVHGSGAGDRDLTLGPNAPYRDIAWGLAARGVAVFRYDKRTKVQPMWFAGKAFTVKDEVTEDALLALGILRRQPEVDPRRTMVIGHSLGGMLAPRIAAADPAIAGIVLLAGATRASLPDQVERQLAYIATLGGDNAAAAAQQREALAPLMATIRALTPADATKTTILMGATPSYYLDLAAYDPAVTARGLKIPILALQGLRDYQVTPDQLDDWIKVYGGTERLTVHRYPALNHLFMSGEGAPSPADYGRAGKVSEDVIADIAAFVKR